MTKKSKAEEKFLDLDYDEASEVFKQTFGYDYNTGNVSKDLTLMDRDVKKAKQSTKKELLRRMV